MSEKHEKSESGNRLNPADPDDDLRALLPDATDAERRTATNRVTRFFELLARWDAEESAG